MMTGPKENSEFGFLDTLNFPCIEAERNMKIQVIISNSDLPSYTLLYLGLYTIIQIMFEIIGDI